MAKSRPKGRNSKMEDLDVNREDFTGQFLTTDQGLRINDDPNSLKAGERGSALLESRDDVIAEMLRWSEDFIERPHRVFGGLPICPFAKAARLKQSIRFEVLCFAAADPFESEGRVMTLIGELLGDGNLETLFVIHPEPGQFGARALEAWVARLNVRLAGCAVTNGLQIFEAHPESKFCIGGVHTRRSPYPSFQVLRRSLLKDASDSLLGSSYYDHFTPEMLRAVGMPHDKALAVIPENPVRSTP